MGKSNRYTEAELRRAMRAVAQVLESRTPGTVCAATLAAAVGEAFDSAATVVYVGCIRPEGVKTGVCASFVAGPAADQVRPHLRRIVHRDVLRATVDGAPNPMIRAGLTCRAQCISRAAWHRSRIYNEYIQPAGLDCWTVLARAHQDTRWITQLITHRAKGESGFRIRDMNLLRALGDALDPALRSVERAFGAAHPGLPARLRRVLDRLLAGDTEKEAARRLGLTPSTVHSYVKELHRHLRVQSRSQLLLRAVERGHVTFNCR